MEAQKKQWAAGQAITAVTAAVRQMSASSRFQAVAVSAGSHARDKATKSWKVCRLISKMVVCTKPAETNWVAGLQDSDRA